MISWAAEQVDCRMEVGSHLQLRKVAWFSNYLQSDTKNQDVCLFLHLILFSCSLLNSMTGDVVVD